MLPSRAHFKSLDGSPLDRKIDEINEYIALHSLRVSSMRRHQARQAAARLAGRLGTCKVRADMQNWRGNDGHKNFILKVGQKPSRPPASFKYPSIGSPLPTLLSFLLCLGTP